VLAASSKLPQKPAVVPVGVDVPGFDNVSSPAPFLVECTGRSVLPLPLCVMHTACVLSAQPGIIITYFGLADQHLLFALRLSIPAVINAH
jgi:hypothetical protein